MENNLAILDSVIDLQVEEVRRPGYTSSDSNYPLYKTIRDIPFTEAVGKLVSDRYFVLGNTLLLELVDALADNPLIKTVGIVESNGSIKGVIIRKILFGLFSKAFAREVYSRYTVASYLKDHPFNPPCYDIKENIFTVSEIIKDCLNSHEDSYFLITRRNRYYGTFNSRDLLIYLAGITRQDFALSKKIQTKIVKERDLGVTKDFVYSTVSIMALDIGGDFYTIKKINHDKYFIALCDVSGKGMSASLISSFLYGFTNSYAHSRGLTKFVDDLNTNLIESFAGEKFITGIFIIFDIKNQKLSIIDMGHSHYSLIIDGKITAVDSTKTNMPLGITTDITLKKQVIEFKRGDRFFTTTDGLLEQNNFLGKSYPMKNIYNILCDSRYKNIDKIADFILKDFNLFRDKIALHDDVTFVLFEYPHVLDQQKSREKEINNSVTKQINSSITEGKPFQIKTSRYHPGTRNFVEETLEKYLEIIKKTEFKTNIAYCIHEMANNAKKANMKRVFFREKGLDIHKTDDYQKGMEGFKTETANNIKDFLEKLKNSGLYIIISFLLKGDYLLVEVINNIEMVEPEKKKIKAKLKIGSKDKKVSEIYAEVADYSEGAGLGIVMTMNLLKDISSHKRPLSITTSKK